jgi:hypothetical protein
MYALAGEVVVTRSGGSIDVKTRLFQGSACTFANFSGGVQNQYLVGDHTSFLSSARFRDVELVIAKSEDMAYHSCSNLLSRMKNLVQYEKSDCRKDEP